MRSLSKEEEERAWALHKKAIVIAAHQDSAICDIAHRRSLNEHSVMARRQIPTLKEGGITAICETVGGDTTLHATFPLSKMSSSASNPLKRALQLIDYMILDLDESKEVVLLATTADDIERAKKEGKVALIMSFEGAKPLEDDLSILHTFYRLNVRMITLAWIHRNLTSDSVFEVSNAGLSEFGVEVVKEMNRLGMVVDVSHLSSQGFQDVIETSADPVIASHSNARSVCDHPRNLTDDQIKALAEKEGVIGLNLWYPTKERPVTADHLLNNVDKMVDLVGAKHVGIGLDLNENYPNEIYRKVWAGTIFSFDFGDTFPRGLESMSKLPTITKGLVERGYSDEEILNILGQNFLRLFRRVFGR